MKKYKKFLLFRLIYEFIFVFALYKGYKFVNDISVETLTFALQKTYYGNFALIFICVCHIVNLILLIASFSDKYNRNFEDYAQFKIAKKWSAQKTQRVLAGITAVLVFVICSFSFVYPAAKEAMPKVKNAYSAFVPSAFFGTDKSNDKEIDIEGTFAFGTHSAAWFQYNPESESGNNDFLFYMTYAYNCNHNVLSKIMEAEVKKAEKSSSYYQAEKTQGEKDGIKYLYVHLSDSTCYELFALSGEQYLHAIIAYPKEQSDVMPYENYILDKCLAFIENQGRS